MLVVIALWLWDWATISIWLLRWLAVCSGRVLLSLVCMCFFMNNSGGLKDPHMKSGFCGGACRLGLQGWKVMWRSIGWGDWFFCLGWIAVMCRLGRDWGWVFDYESRNWLWVYTGFYYGKLGSRWGSGNIFLEDVCGVFSIYED